MLVMVLLFLLLLMLLLIMLVYEGNIGYSYAVLAIDRGGQDRGSLCLVISISLANSVYDCDIYSSFLPAQDNDTLKTQLIL